MTPKLDDAARTRLLDYVRPLSVGLDGMTNFGWVERRLAAAERLRALFEAAGEGDVDGDRLFLLAAFALVPIRRIAPGSRTELLLASAGVPREEVAWLVGALRRFETSPEGPEERLVHDAGLLETVGAYGVTQALVAGTRERATLAEMADDVEARMAAARFATTAAENLAAERVAFARLFARKLKEEAAEFETRP